MKTLRVLSAFSVLLAVTLSLANVPQAAADPVKGVVSLECSVPTTTGSVITGASSSDSTTTVLATGNSCVEAIKELINIDHYLLVASHAVSTVPATLNYLFFKGGFGTHE